MLPKKIGLPDKRAAMVGLATIAIGLIAGCGGGGGGGGGDTGSTISTSALSKAAYIKRMDAVCLKYHERFQAAFSAYLKTRRAFATASGGAAASLPFFARIGLPLAKAEAKAARALEAPTGAASEVDGMLTAFEKWIKELETTIRTKDTSEFGRRYPEHYKASRLAKEFGLSGKCLVL
jgi:hypothetical protein